MVAEDSALQYSCERIKMLEHQAHVARNALACAQRHQNASHGVSTDLHREMVCNVAVNPWTSEDGEWLEFVTKASDVNDSNGSSNDVRIFIGRTGEPLMPVLKSKLTFSDWVEG